MRILDLDFSIGITAHEYIFLKLFKFIVHVDINKPSTVFHLLLF